VGWKNFSARRSRMTVLKVVIDIARFLEDEQRFIRLRDPCRCRR
jgi:hypothetical protein